MDTTTDNSCLTAVRLVGEVDHPDFRNAVAMLHETSQCEIDANTSPEVVVVAQSRPGKISHHEVELLQRRWPLAGIVAILGSWCEGETRTGLPWPGVKRLYWYEFPAWWRQQVALRTIGHCPEWARPTAETYRAPLIRDPNGTHPPGRKFRKSSGAVILSSASRNTAQALGEVLHDAGYATVWNPPLQPKSIVRGAVAGIWDGGQLDDHELPSLLAFCRSLARDAAPVVALLDFPRRDRCEVAKKLGVVTVLGKPWINADLVAVIDDIASHDAEISKSSGRAA